MPSRTIQGSSRAGSWWLFVSSLERNDGKSNERCQTNDWIRQTTPRSQYNVIWNYRKEQLKVCTWIDSPWVSRWFKLSHPVYNSLTDDEAHVFTVVSLIMRHTSHVAVKHNWATDFTHKMITQDKVWLRFTKYTFHVGSLVVTCQWNAWYCLHLWLHHLRLRAPSAQLSTCLALIHLLRTFYTFWCHWCWNSL